MTQRQVEWRIDAANSRAIRASTYVWIGLFGGGLLLLFGLISLFAIGSAIAGEYVIAVLIVLLFLVGGPVSLLYLLPAIRSGSFSPLSQFVLDVANDPEESLGERYARVFSWRTAILSIVVHIFLIPALISVDPRLLAGYIGLNFALLVVSSGFVTWGRIDPTIPIFEYRYKTVPLQAVERARKRSLGDITVCWLSYRSGTATVSTPSWIVFTPEAAHAFEAALENVEGTPQEKPASNSLITLVAIVIGSGSIAFTGMLWFLTEIDPAFALYITVIFGSIGVFFIWIGLFHS